MKKTRFVLPIVFIVFTSLFLANFVSAIDLKGAGSIEEILTKITVVVKGVAVAMAGAMVALAGLFFIVSGGSPETISRAKKCLMYAVLGGIVALSAGALAKFLESTASK